MYFFVLLQQIQELLVHFSPGPSKPLPNKLEEFMKSSGDDGVILVAYGTTLGTLDKEILTVMARAFAKFPQKFIWKLNEGNHCRE